MISRSSADIQREIHQDRTPIDRVREALERGGYEPRPTSRGYRARCPAHDDQRPSLDIDEGDDGRALLICRSAGCEVPEIARSLGLEMSDLMPESDLRPAPAPRRATRPDRSSPGPDRDAIIAPPTASADEAAAHIRGISPTRTVYIYRRDGVIIGAVVRAETPTGKTIRQLRLDADGWRMRAMDEPRPLYHGPAVAPAPNKIAILLEGEGCVDAALEIDLPGVTPLTAPGGANSAGKADWSTTTIYDRVIIWRDRDDAGLSLQRDACEQITRHGTPVHIIEPPTSLPDHGDIVDYISMARAHGDSDDEIRASIMDLIEGAEPHSGSSWPVLDPLERRDLPEFPAAALPRIARDWVLALSRETQTPPVMPAMLLLSVASSCIARYVSVRVWEAWYEPTNTYSCVLMPPGNRKSAAFAAATAPLREIEAEEIEAARPAVAQAQSQRRIKEAALARAEREAARSGASSRAAAHLADTLAAELATEPQPALPLRIVDDVTSERLGMILAEQGGRIGCYSAEGAIIDIIGGAYRQGGPGRLAEILSAHAGDTIRTQRVGRADVTIERPAMTIGMAIQPQAIMGIAHRSTLEGRGLLARFLWARPSSWVGSREIRPPAMPDAIREAYRQMIRRLAATDTEVVLTLEPESEEILYRWMQEIEPELGEGGTMELVAEWASKLAGATVRIAGILHSIEHGPEGAIIPETMGAAVEIARSLVPHAEAVLLDAGASSDPAMDDARYVLRWIERGRRTTFTRRECQQHGKQSRFARAERLDEALAELERRGYIRQAPQPPKSGPGRPASPVYEVRPPDDAESDPIYPQYPHYSTAALNIEDTEHSEDRVRLADDREGDEDTPNNEDSEYLEEGAAIRDDREGIER